MSQDYFNYVKYLVWIKFVWEQRTFNNSVNRVPNIRLCTCIDYKIVSAQASSVVIKSNCLSRRNKLLFELVFPVVTFNSKMYTNLLNIPSSSVSPTVVNSLTLVFIVNYYQLQKQEVNSEVIPCKKSCPTITSGVLLKLKR